VTNSSPKKRGRKGGEEKPNIGESNQGVAKGDIFQKKEGAHLWQREREIWEDDTNGRGAKSATSLVKGGA